jgi:hypothetical protein
MMRLDVNSMCSEERELVMWPPGVLLIVLEGH